ncbi:MAG: MBL fold metallo-hydrolase [Gemmataceae bacterium]|nr:MBL fold metallo-hydrolase [Gemmataceae bacterium]
MQLIAENVWLLRGFPRDMFNVYLAGDTLIDAGTRWAKRRILRQLHGKAPRMVALTHCHPDHQGTAAYFCDRYGIPLACHEADVDAMEGRIRMQPENRVIRLGEWCWSGKPYRVGNVLRDGDRFGDFRVVHAPGHTPGHVFYFRERDRLAIVGDVLANMNFVTRKPGLREPPPIFTVDRLLNRRSIQTLAGLRPSVVCFGHGPPLRDLAVIEQFAAARATPQS